MSLVAIFFKFTLCIVTAKFHLESETEENQNLPCIVGYSLFDYSWCIPVEIFIYCN